MWDDIHVGRGLICPWRTCWMAMSWSGLRWFGRARTTSFSRRLRRAHQVWRWPLVKQYCETTLHFARSPVLHDVVRQRINKIFFCSEFDELNHQVKAYINILWPKLPCWFDSSAIRLNFTATSAWSTLPPWIWQFRLWRCTRTETETSLVDHKAATIFLIFYEPQIIKDRIHYNSGNF